MINNLFLCVGAQKAGTTWLNAQLNSHPDVGFSDVKEVHYFNTIHNSSILLTRRKVEHIKRTVNNNPDVIEKYFADLSAGNQVDPGLHRLFSKVDDDWYISLFSKNNKKYSADFSPEYALIGKAGFENVKAVSRRQHIVFMMRDPIDRAKSAIKYFYQMKGLDIKDIESQELIDLASSSLILDMSDYTKTITCLESEFAKEDVLYLFYEEVMCDKQKAIDKVCEFLKIEKIIIPQENLEKRVNTTEYFEFNEEVTSVLVEKLSHVYAFVYNNFDYIDGWAKIKVSDHND